MEERKLKSIERQRTENEKFFTMLQLKLGKKNKIAQINSESSDEQEEAEASFSFNQK